MFDERRFSQASTLAQRSKEKKADAIPAWFSEKRLPSLKEIQENKNGFPSVEEEKMLQQLFFAKIRPQVIPFFSKISNGLSYSMDMVKQKKQKTVSEFSPAQVDQVCAYLYGIYFYNYIAKGRIFDYKLNYSQTEKAEKKAAATVDASTTFDDPYNRSLAIRQIAPQMLDPMDLDDWPLKVQPGVLAYHAQASADLRFMYINTILERFIDVPLHKKHKVIATRGKGLFKSGEISFDTLPMPEWVRTGIEEASHIDFTKLRLHRYEAATEKRRKVTGEARQIFIGSEHVDAYGPLKNLAERREVEKQIVHSSSILDYDSLIANEFAAHVVQAAYTQKYDPETWNSGYSYYHKAVRTRRNEVLKQQKRK